MFRSRVLQLAATALVVAAVPAGAVAASSDTEPDEAGATTGTETSAPPNGTAASGTEDDDDAGIEPPIDIEFQIDMMLGLVPQDEMSDYWAEQGEEQQLAIQACMNEAGFEYAIEDQSAAFADPLGDMPRLEYAEQFGFGIWTTMNPAVDPYADMATNYEWPNDEIVGALSESERNAWYEVNLRCSNDVYGSMENDPYRNPQVQQAMEDFFTDIYNDPRVRDAEVGWSVCMEEAGYPFPSEQAMWNEVQADDDDGSLRQQFYETEAWNPSSENHAEWQQLVDREIEIAVANAGCSEPLEAVREEVTQDLRDELVTVWQTIDWSLPPVTFEGEGDVFLTGEEDPFDEDPFDDEPAGSVEARDDETGETNAPQAGLDLGDPTETTEA